MGFLTLEIQFCDCSVRAHSADGSIKVDLCRRPPVSLALTHLRRDNTGVDGGGYLRT